ncbi:MAG: CRISPR-associated endonuclease Cas3'' [Eubacteriales bacterium]|nr:CRISPR-associated endonuclease Cas3'' [Eubacteriales bacterium]
MMIAHSTEDGREQSLAEHLQAVARLSGEFADAFGMRDYGEWIGKLHDLGKAAPKSQRRMRGIGGPVDHSTFGAQIAWGKIEGPPPMRLDTLLAYAVAGHHAGLPDGGTSADLDGPTLQARMRKVCAPECAAFARDFPHAPPASPIAVRPFDAKPGFTMAFLVRMLFSCLVDADYLDTETFMSGGAVHRAETPPLQTLLEPLERRLASFGEPTDALGRIRRSVLERCREAAPLRPGLFTLTVPTGGGKTLSSLAFALHHAVLHGMRRVVYAIPYTSIIEQNAAVFAKALGPENVLTHYADAYADDDGSEDVRLKRLACENWDAPVIVTTNVRLFESLFAAKTGACRKLHRLARSVIVLDEAQMLPTPLLLPCLRALAELMVNYGCTVLLMSATQPPLGPLFPQGESALRPIEIMDDIPGLFRALERVAVRDLGTQTNAELIERIGGFAQALCIVNSKRHARALYELLPEEGRFCLTTLLTPGDRKAMIAEIRRRLKAGEVCRVISTSLIEAGVDVDFPVGFRARTGLDSVAQTAGRVNREGLRSGAVLYLFDEEPDFSSARLVFVSQPASLSRLLADRPPIAPDTLSEYFRLLYHARGSLDEKRMLERFDGVGTMFPFRAAAEAFHLIESEQYSIFVPRSDEDRALAQRLLNGEYSRELIRALGPGTVAVYAAQRDSLMNAGALCEVLPGSLYLLTDERRYRPDAGLCVEAQAGAGICI